MTQLELVNMALARCGAEPIISLTDTSKRALQVVLHMESVLRDLLNETPWSFAINRVAISQAGEPAYRYAAQYLLPVDHIRILEIENVPEYRIEGGNILCDTLEEIKIKYVFYQPDTTKWTASFQKVYVLKLAEAISYVLVQSTPLQQTIAQEAERYLRKARSYNSQEVGMPDSRYPSEYTIGLRI